MSIPTLCRRLLQTSDPERRMRLLERASEPEYAAFLIEEARSRTPVATLEALNMADLAVEITDRCGDSHQNAVAWRIRAQALRLLGRHSEAAEAFQKAAESARAAGDARLAVQVQIGCVDSLGWLGRYDEAVALARRLEDDMGDNGLAEDAEDAAKLLVNVGNLHFRRDQYVTALDCYQRALEALVRSGDEIAIARVQSNCANILTRLHRVDEAIALYERARAVFDVKEMGAATAMVDANIGFLRSISGEYPAALASTIRARHEFAAREQELETAKCDAAIADIYRILNLYPESLEHYDRAIDVFERISVDYERACSELGRAAVRMAVDRSDEAFVSLESADSIFRMQKNSLQRAHVRLMRAYLLRHIGDNPAATRSAQAAARTLARSGQSGWAAEARFLLADLALEEGLDATRRMQSVKRAARQHGRGWLECRAERALGRYYLRKDDVGRALRHFRAAISALERTLALVAPEDLHVAFLRDKLTIYEDIVGTLLKTNRRKSVLEALEYVERSKSRLLLERVQTALDGRRIVSGSVTAEANERLAALRSELCRNYHRLNSFADGEQRRLIGTGSVETIAPLERAYRAALREIEVADTEANPEGMSLIPVVSANLLQANLQSDETLVEFYIVNSAVCAFVITRNEVRVRSDIAQIDDVAFAGRRLRYHLQRGELHAQYVQSHAGQMNAQIRSVLQHLYDLLLKPIQEMLTTEKLVIVPHGVLHGLPFHALFDGTQYALDRWECTYAPSAAVWYTGARRAHREATNATRTVADDTALLVGVPAPGIEHVAIEVGHLACILPKAQVLCGEHATIESFREHAGHSRWIHLASHALFRADNPLFSGLRFSDGWLLARDLYEMRLDCELATLSACHTGAVFVEPGDELFGIIRGFLAAGVRSLAVSLWPADDAATAALMVHFYRRLAEGWSKSAALRDAQRAMRNEYPHPYYWAAFTLVGER